MEKARIVDNWVICPVCGKRQFPVSGVIQGLRYRCKTSRSKNEHFMIIDSAKGECEYE